jgi:hypothetical protein
MTELLKEAVRTWLDAQPRTFHSEGTPKLVQHWNKLKNVAPVTSVLLLCIFRKYNVKICALLYFHNKNIISGFLRAPIGASTKAVKVKLPLCSP